MSRSTRPTAAVVLVFLHLLVAPCAAAMALMAADADCGHCRVVDGLEECLTASAVARAVIENGLLDSNRADPRHPSGQLATQVSATLAGLPAAVTDPLFRGRSLVARRTGDPPLYLLLGQLRI